MQTNMLELALSIVVICVAVSIFAYACNHCAAPDLYLQPDRFTQTPTGEQVKLPESLPLTDGIDLSIISNKD